MMQFWLDYSYKFLNLLRFQCSLLCWLCTNSVIDLNLKRIQLLMETQVQPSRIKNLTLMSTQSSP